MDAISTGLTRMYGRAELTRPWMVVLPYWSAATDATDVAVDLLLLVMFVFTIGWGHRVLRRCIPVINDPLGWWGALGLGLAYTSYNTYLLHKTNTPSPLSELNPYLKLNDAAMRAMVGSSQPLQKDPNIRIIAGLYFLYVLARVKASKRPVEGYHPAILAYVAAVLVYPVAAFGWGEGVVFYLPWVIAVFVNFMLLNAPVDRCTGYVGTVWDPRGKAGKLPWVGRGNMGWLVAVCGVNVWWLAVVGIRGLRELKVRQMGGGNDSTPVEIPIGVLRMFGRTLPAPSAAPSPTLFLPAVYPLLAFASLFFLFFTLAHASSHSYPQHHPTTDFPPLPTTLTAVISPSPLRLGLLLPPHGGLYLKGAGANSRFDPDEVAKFLHRKLVKINGVPVKESADVRAVLHKHHAEYTRLKELAEAQRSESNSDSDEEAPPLEVPEGIRVELEFQEIQPRYVTLGRRCPSAFSAWVYPKGHVNLYDTGSSVENLGEVFFG